MKNINIFAWFFAQVIFIQSIQKVPYRIGTVCNYEVQGQGQLKSLKKYFCLTRGQCVKKRFVERNALMPYDGCRAYMLSPDNESPQETPVCCHQEDMTQEDVLSHTRQLTYLPGLRSFMMCKEYSHTICGPSGSYCKEDDAVESQKFQGLPTYISKYPHTALIGYHDLVKDDWHWFCQGSIISKNFILTMWSCLTNNEQPATHVKLGESRVCPLDHCPDKDDDDNLEIAQIVRENTKNSLQTYDLALVKVDKPIQFNKYVRPACIYYDLNTRQAEAWFAPYTKPEKLIKTTERLIPIFAGPIENNFISFKVKSPGEARVMLSRSGLPHRNEFFYEFVLGTSNNQETTMLRNNMDIVEYHKPTPNILSGEKFQGFWIHIKYDTIEFGKEGSTVALMRYVDSKTDLSNNLRAVGVSSWNNSAEWILRDYWSLKTLHDFEMMVTYTEECKEAVGNFTAEAEEEINKAILFCAGNPGKKFGPCNNDWGGSIQFREERFECMWQLFGALVRQDPAPADCDSFVKPSIFKSLNIPIILEWLEEVVYPEIEFTTDVEAINLDQPKCVY